MRKFINIIESHTDEHVESILKHGLETNATYLGRFQSTDYSGLVSRVVTALHHLGIEPRVVKLGNTIYRDGLLDDLFSGGVVILDVRGNIRAHIGEKRFEELEHAIINARASQYPVSIVILEYGPSQFSHEITNRFIDLNVIDTGQDISDGGIYKLT